MTENKLVFLTDRSAVETDDTCGMKFWWNRKEGGKGIVPVDEAEALLVGRTVHEDMLTIGELKDLRQEAIEEIIDDILIRAKPDRSDTRRMEILYRRLGWLAAWALFIEPGIRERWDNLALEHEMILDRSPLYVAFTPDRLLKSKQHGFIKYLEYKSTISASKKWLDSWMYAIQLHISLAGVKEEFPDLSIKFAQVAGLMKGNYSQSGEKRLMHPYVWGWYNESEGKWANKYEDGRRAGFEPMPVWEYEQGIVRWVLTCGDETARMQFPHTSPIFLNDAMLDGWVARRVHRENVIRQVENECRTDPVARQIFFEQRTKNCKPPFGDACPYLKACWNAGTARDPLADPEYVVRTPHHDLEIIGIEV